MEIKSAKFVGSYPKASNCPADGRPEFAFIGRSNVGKSTLINMLVGQKGLAKVSGTPGKTQLLNFFDINEAWYLVDLPGYGFARTSKTMRAGFTKMIRTYFESREPLALAFVLIDSNIEPRPIDIEFCNFMGEAGAPFALVFTKADKSTQLAVQTNIRLFFNELKKTWETMPPHFITASQRRLGREDLLRFIEKSLKTIKKNKLTNSD